MSETVPLVIITQSCPQGSQIIDKKIQGVLHWHTGLGAQIKSQIKAKLIQENISPLLKHLT